MKYLFLKKYLCIGLASAMIISGPAAVFAEDLLTSETQVVSEILVDTPVPAQPVIEQTPVPAPPAPEPAEPEPAEPAIAEPVPEVPTPAAPVPETPAPEPAEPQTDTVTPVPDEAEDITDTPAPEATPTVSPDEEPLVSPTDTPDLSPTQEPDVSATATPEPEISPTETPTPEPSPTETPTPEPSPTETPTPTPTVIPEKVQWIIDEIDKLMKLPKLTLDQREIVEKIRAEYDKLDGEEKKLVTNYKDFEKIEEEMNRLIKEDEELDDEDNGPTLIYRVSNIRAGREFYISTLRSKYHLSFSSGFSSVMDQIELEYKEANDLLKEGENQYTQTTSRDTLLVRNWQDILAVYVYRHHKQGEESYTLDASSKEELAEIFAEMNPVVRNKVNIKKFSYGNRHIDYYIRNNKLVKEDRDFLKRYVETDCKLLCAVSTAAKGFVRQSVGEDVSEERVNVITAAYSLIGKVGYFWGGKSDLIGSDSRWGAPAMVMAEGSTTTGTIRAYGLDCSGFVSWSVINGYKSPGMLAYIGHGTCSQWFHCNTISASNAQAGDLVFAKGPEAGSDNHVGILCGQTDSGDWIAVHCTASKNGITVGEAYSASFRYIRQPAFFPSDAQVEAMIMDELSDGKTEGEGTGESVSLHGTDYLDDLISGALFVGYTDTSQVELIDDSEVESF